MENDFRTKNMNIPKNYMNRYLGYKFYKEKDNGEIELIRVAKCNSNNNVVCIDQDTGTNIITNVEAMKEYTPLEPFGMISFNVVEIADTRDVVVMLYKYLDIKMRIQQPFAICRQSINDFFADYVFNNPEKNNIVGVSCTIENCPANINFAELAACDKIIESDVVYIYRDDNLDNIQKYIPHLDFINTTLKKLMVAHIRATKQPAEFKFYNNKKCVDGWCIDLDTLLRENNFLADLDSMCGVVTVDFNLSNYLNTRETGVRELNYIALLFFDEVFKVNAVETRVTEYNHSINMAKFNNNNYVFIRDNTNTVYLVVYLVSGEFLEKELEEKARQVEELKLLHLSYFDKYIMLKKKVNKKNNNIL